MKTEILIVSYSKDIEYLRLNLKTIAKFAQGFSGIRILVPSDEAGLFSAMGDVKTYQRNLDQSTWHLAAQCQKCFADKHCPNADFVLHTDSDCIFTDQVTPDDYLVAGKPVMLYEAYKNFNPPLPWQPVTEAVLKLPVEYEFMRRHPQVNPVGIYSDLRKHVESLHGMDFVNFTESRKPDYPWGFTEHNIIGAFAFYSPKWHHKYHWIEVGKQEVPKDKIMQFWSHSPVGTEQSFSHYWHNRHYRTGTPSVITERILNAK